MSEIPALTPTSRPADTAEVRSMFDAIAPTYDLLNTVLSAGLHRVWEKRLVSSLPLTATGRHLDLCTGTGALVPRLAPRCHEVHGVDISPEMLAVAQRRWRGISNVKWLQADAQELPFAEGSFETVSIAYGVRNLPRLEVGLREVRRVLSPGGVVGILEFGQPHHPLWRRIFSWYSQSVIPRVGGLISGAEAAYQYLPITAAAFPCGATFEALLTAQGLRPLISQPLLGGVAYIYTAQR